MAEFGSDGSRPAEWDPRSPSGHSQPRLWLGQSCRRREPGLPSGSPQGNWGQGSEWQGAPEAEGLEEEEEVQDFCLGASRVKAAKSCLTCMVNYCPEHLVATPRRTAGCMATS